MVYETFKEAYALARTNRSNPLWAGEFIRFNGGTIYVSGISGIVVVGRELWVPGAPYFHTVDQSRHSVAYRRLRVEHSRKYGPVPLP